MSLAVHRVVRCAKLALPALALAFFPTPAQAKIWIPIGSQFAGAMFMLLDSSSHCIAYAYDVNGNRISVSSSTVGSGAVTWGTGKFGCFVWTQ